MAGTFHGAAAPLFPIPTKVRDGLVRSVPVATRTRRNHGVFIFGDDLACVYSSRRSGDDRPVQLVIGHADILYAGHMTIVQARLVARALVAAADAADAQRQPVEV